MSLTPHSAPQDPFATSSSRLEALEEVEKKLVHLVEVAGQAIAALGSSSIRGPEALEDFKRATTSYYETLESIQKQLRVEFRRIREAGIGEEEVPWRAGELIGEEMDTQTWVQATRVLSQAIKGVVEGREGEGGEGLNRE
ncbi:MAG: mediator complex protein-domain-containing protein [Piptocephalis tieghemiana]|nr:MAG: mediator complex protein-domain-containing protein [Piptocephalis tieghemiana]